MFLPLFSGAWPLDGCVHGRTGGDAHQHAFELADALAG
jgi:hypothetical protein